MLSRSFFPKALASVLLAFGSASAWAASASPPLVFAPSSLTDVLQAISAAYTRERRSTVKLSFGSTATLARQIESGARADVFLSADLAWMDYLAERALIDLPSRKVLLGNRLVLVAPANSTETLQIAKNFPLQQALGKTGRLAIADPQSAPAGRYGRAALQYLGVWPALEPRLAITDNVRSALLFVARGEAPFGIVYATDARAEPRVRIVGMFPEDSHPAIIYPVALVRNSGSAGTAFIDYLSSPTARRIFSEAGFTLLTGAARRPVR